MESCKFSPLEIPLYNSSALQILKVPPSIAKIILTGGNPLNTSALSCENYARARSPSLSCTSDVFHAT